MTRRTGIRLAVLALSAIAVVILMRRQPAEPVFRGMPISYWLARLEKRVDINPRASIGRSPVGLADFNERQTAREAIKEIGTNALPELMQMFRRSDSPIRVHLVSWVSRHPWLKSRLNLRPPATEDWCCALDAITCLGPAGQPALPAVLPLATNQNSAVKIKAFFALTSISPPTDLVKPIVPTLFRALGDGDWTMRLAAINALAALRPPPPEAAPAFVPLLNDPNGPVSEAAMNFLVAQTNQIVLPVLDKQLREKDSYVVTEAAAHIGVFGPAAAGSVPRLRELLDDPLLTVRQAATNALAAITGQTVSIPAADEKADQSFNFQGIPLESLLSAYEDMAAKKVTLPPGPLPLRLLRVRTVRPLTKSDALQCLEEAMKEQAGLLIVHGPDASLTAVAKPPVAPH